VLATLAVTASAGVAMPARAEASDPANLVDDPGFALGTGAWTSVPGSSLSLVPGHDGHRAVRVTNDTDKDLTLALNDRANTVARTQARASYTASAWIRTTAPGVSVAAREGEWHGADSNGDNQSAAWLSDSAWHFVTVTYDAVDNGGSIDFNVLGWQIPDGQSIDVSEPSLTTDRDAAVVDAPPTPGAPSGYRLAFSDEFDDNTLDTRKWRVHDNSWSSNEESIDTSRPDNLFEADGALTLRAQREGYTVHGTTRHYTSASMDTIGRHSWKYGRFEMRAKLPTTVGSWPAFWLRGDHSLGEIDVMEAVGGMPSFVAQTVHQSTNGGRGRLTHGVDPLAGGSRTSDWHTYGVTVTPSAISWDIDGDTLFTVNASGAPWITSAFDDTLNIRINLQVGGSMPAYFHLPVTAASKFPADYSIDYVRVYQRT
jgi:beta-glucanase (GH16 family)